MDVFLIPAGAAHYQLYCEVGDAKIPSRPGAGALDGWWASVFARVSSFASRVEQARHGAAARRAARAPRKVGRRVKDRAICWLAERIAEQRLLWHLRNHRDAVLWFPDDLSAEDAHAQRVRILRRDGARHLAWMLPDSLLLLICVLLITPLPGPNLPGYYFTFRVGGHVLSWIGARHGLRQVAWTGRPTEALTQLRRVIALDAAHRRPAIADIAGRLRLQHLASFLDRIAVPTA